MVLCLRSTNLVHIQDEKLTYRIKQHPISSLPVKWKEKTFTITRAKQKQQTTHAHIHTNETTTNKQENTHAHIHTQIKQQTNKIKNKNAKPKTYFKKEKKMK